MRLACKQPWIFWFPFYGVRPEIMVKFSHRAFTVKIRPLIQVCMLLRLRLINKNVINVLYLKDSIINSTRQICKQIILYFVYVSAIHEQVEKTFMALFKTLV